MLEKLMYNKSMFDDFIGYLLIVVFSHRHNKDINDPKVALKDFSIVRDTMYKYSKKAEERYLSIPALAFFFISFATSQSGLDFVYSKVQDKDHQYLQRIKQEINDLRDEAYQYLRLNDKFISMI